MNRYLESTRSAFRHQPVQHLIVDVGYPMTSFTLENCISAMQDVLSLGCSIRGSNSIPGLGLSTIGTYFKSIIQLDSIKGNYVKFHNAIESLREMVDSMPTSADGFKANLLEAITAAIEDFRFKPDNTGGVWQFSSQLQITLLTKKSGLEIQETMEEIFQEINTIKVKKIMVVELICPLVKFPMKEKCSQLPQAIGFVELTQVIANKPKLEEYFKHWLLDCNTDHEHMRLTFCGAVEKPGEFATFQENQNLELKCDISECVINPMSLPFCNRFMIQTDLLGLSLGGSMVKAQGNDLAIYELVILSRLPYNGICESLLYGQPLRLTPTQSWRLEWAKILENIQCFSALCKELTANEEFLLAQLKPHQHSDPVSGYFILVPGEGSLLLKAIAPGEIILPNKDVKFDRGILEEVPKDVHFRIISLLNELPFHSEYEPQFWKSGLHSALHRNFMSNKKSSVQILDRDSKASNPRKEQRRMTNKENVHNKGVSPNLIVRGAIAASTNQLPRKSQKEQRGEILPS